MTEVYSILNQPTPDANSGLVIGIWVFWGVVFLILLFSLFKKLTTQNVVLGRIIGNVLGMAFIIVVFIFFGIGIWSEKQTYTECMEAWESGSYYVESGEPGRLEIYPPKDADGNTVYEVSFWINERYFDSYLAYGEGDFSKDDLKLIESSNFFEVKYFVDGSNDNIILSMSVGEKTDQKR